MSGDRFFYGLSPVEMSLDKFIERYSGCYYIGGENNFVLSQSRLSQSSRYIEGQIDDLLERGIREKRDVARILAWKIGKIRHGKSEKNGKFEYAEDWRRADELDVTLYKKPFELKKIATFITDHIDELERQADENPQAVLDSLRHEKIDGLGSVYLITLLYFISKGKWPIYDRFAKMALYAIIHDIKPGGAVEYKGLPDKNDDAFSNIMKNEMEEYIGELKQVFGDRYLNSRDVDRALWVYGHLFKLK